MRLVRFHGLGNDYLVLAAGPPLTPELVRALCDRHTGVGGDGVLEPGDVASDVADHGVRIWNPDGSIAGKSGNGLRIFARWLSDERGAGAAFSIWTGVGRVTCEVDPDPIGPIAVEMGVASFRAADVPCREARVDGELAGAPGPVTTVGLGNPHCVVWVPDPDAVDWRAAGARLERDPFFPERTNVQHATVLGPGRLRARIWERGAGETLASGSSACAVAASAVRTGRAAPGRITVEMAGGALQVDVAPDFALRLVGPVERVGEVAVDAGWLARRVGAQSQRPSLT